VSTSDIGGHHAGRYPSAVQGGMAGRLLFKMPVSSCAARRQGIACVRKVTMQLPNRPRLKPIAAVALLEATTGGVGSKKITIRRPALIHSQVLSRGGAVW
jgi:hypothetical protein